MNILGGGRPVMLGAWFGFTLVRLRHETEKSWYGNVLTGLQPITLPRSDSSRKRWFPFCVGIAQRFPPSEACQGTGSNQHTTEDWGRMNGFKRLDLSFTWPCLFCSFIQPWLCFSLFPAQLWEIKPLVINLSLKNNSYENAGFPFSIQIGGRKHVRYVNMTDINFMVRSICPYKPSVRL